MELRMEKQCRRLDVVRAVHYVDYQYPVGPPPGYRYLVSSTLGFVPAPGTNQTTSVFCSSVADRSRALARRSRVGDRRVVATVRRNVLRHSRHSDSWEVANDNGQLYRQ
jgi:hypothetical protein